MGEEETTLSPTVNGTLDFVIEPDDDILDFNFTEADEGMMLSNYSLSGSSSKSMKSEKSYKSFKSKSSKGGSYYTSTATAMTTEEGSVDESVEESDSASSEGAEEGDGDGE